MYARSARLLLVLPGLLLASGPRERARAQEVQVEAHSKRKLTASHAQDATASGTELSLTDRVTMPRSLGDVVRESPGALVTSTGGIGALATLSLRGAGSEETLVLIDDIPISTPDGGAFDLSLFPAELFATVSTFRGGAPVWLGSGAIGGVLQLVPQRRARNRLSAALGAGSFGTYQVHGGTEVGTDRGIRAHTQVVVRTTRGDYPYVDDRGTRFDSSDDRSFRLKNADFLEASGLHDLTVPLGKGALHVLALGVIRGGGFPGPASQPTPLIRRETGRALGAVSYAISADEDGAHARKLQVVASGAFGADRFTDRYGQLGLSQQTAADNRSFRGFVRAAGSLHLVRWLEASLVSSYAYDAYLPFDFLAGQPASSARQTAASALELVAKGKIGRTRFELRPSARMEWSRTDLHATASFSRPFTPHRRYLVPTARVGAVVEPWRGVAFSASAATGTRMPTLYELFGDAGLVLPSLNLVPVASTSYDGGVSVRGHHRSLRGSAELRGFWQERRDSIAMFRTSQFQVGHENIASVRQWGAESHLSGSLTSYFHLSGSFTWLDTETALGKRLPFRPRYLAYARPELRIPIPSRTFSSVSFASELWHRSFAFVDRANLAYAAACSKLGASGALGMFRDRVRFSARMDDALDARCTDLVGYPLPGRSLFFSLSYQEGFHEES